MWREEASGWTVVSREEAEKRRGLKGNGLSSPLIEEQENGLENPFPGRLETEIKNFCAIPQMLAFLKDCYVPVVRCPDGVLAAGASGISANFSASRSRALASGDPSWTSIR